jgi:low affinity Fe/Cu permease
MPSEHKDHPGWVRFGAIARSASNVLGSGRAFAVACAVVLAWALTGPLFRYSDTWQLVINTGTTVLTFLMVFLIQNTMNRDSAALHLKLDELISVTSQARDALIGAERLDEDQIHALENDVRTDV